ncbi:flavin-containing monooxygenase [Rhodococcus maanshanensis]|uniref:Predicted flavoprotein CzcO associated with the cation diffusion facilitator CzcD n=1 Tax=Rhodococcus maanshanensis TaxID=183556 RepID=A0A1H7HUH3_9NOCA|nr:NAD(P)/FAD-dependent oxidoreductase [Rhodococcus maanshanensis]SEK54003.1 Predicted flavoprotein CzcO associated with the cation diffusion facilitator CzcD [Rhodococcus maanshanensis]
MTATPRSPALPDHVAVLVVGAGFAGLAVTERVLRDDPAADILVIERAADLGGTWRDNTYPGCACDVPTALYSFSFAPSPDWSHTFARQPEIQRYLRKAAADTGIRDRILTGCELLEASWDDDEARWRVRTTLGELTAQTLVAATGALSTPRLPGVPGIETFRGRVFHSATWDHDYDLTGKRVAVIGTGASAVQFVPEIADRVERLTVYQRTPAWVLPRGDRTLSHLEKRLYRRIPLTQKMVRATVYTFREGYVLAMAKAPRLLPAFQLVAKAHLRRQVPDRALRRKLTPTFTITCKRVLLSNDWLRTLARDDVDLVDSGLVEVTEGGVVDGAGTQTEVDAIVFATGFSPTEPPVAQHLRGRDGQTLAQHWAGSPRAYLGTTIAGFPNLFLMYGPNTNLGHSSIVYMLESQAAYINGALAHLAADGGEAVEVLPAAQARYNERIADQLASTVWNTGGCSSWYLDKEGRNSVMWPTFTFRYRSRTKRFDAENYQTRRAVRASVG